jgi:arabinan endo-1,5-alpha-L-arabinosidase
MTELDPDSGKLLQDPPRLTLITAGLGEGVFVIRDPDYYYIFASRGRCCSGLESTYQIIMGRAKDIQGPYLAKDGKSWQENHYTLFLEGDYEEPGRGHNGFFQENDTTFIVYHAYTRSAEGAALLNIKPLYVDDDGWPTIVPGEVLFRMKTQSERD